MVIQKSLSLGIVIAALACSGCGNDRLPLAPVEGKVIYNGSPLEFGSVMFQPDHGPPARADIQADGTFVLSTYEERDGAAMGRHQVRITCCESQRPQSRSQGISVPEGEDAPPDKSYIPQKYTMFPTSGLTAVVEQSNAPFVIELK